MKRNMLFLIFFLLPISPANSAPCIKMARRLSMLQNRIAQQSFQKLSPGAWASFGSVRIVYLGRQISPKSGKKLRVIEVSGSATGQVWYRFVSHTFRYHGEKLRFLLLEPVEAYVKTGGTFLYLTTAMVEIFLKGTPWGKFLDKGVAFSPPGCGDLPVIKRVVQTLPGGKRVRAYVLHSEAYHGTVTCSPEIPFGLIRLRSAGDHAEVRLVKYGCQGGQSRIPRQALKNAMSISFSLRSKDTKKGGQK